MSLDNDLRPGAVRTGWEPLDVVTALSHVLTVADRPLDALGAPPGTADAFLAGLDELTGSALQFPLRPRESSTETVVALPTGRVALSGGRPAVVQALFTAWFLGNDVTIVDPAENAWQPLARALAGSGLPLPPLRVSGTADGATLVEVGERPVAWADLAHTGWASALFRTQVLPGGVSLHRAGPSERRLRARWRLLLDRARQDPGLSPAPPAVFDGDPAVLEPQTKQHLEAYSGPHPADGQVLRSGASTGAPRFITYTGGDWRRMVAEAIPVLYAAGLEPGDRVVNTLFGGSLYGGLTTSLCELSRMGVLNFTTAQHATPESLAALATRFGINAIVGQPALLLPLLRDTHRMDPSFRLDKVVFGGTALAEHDRRWLEDTLGTRLISSILAANDGAQIAYQCPHQRGRTHHLVDDYNYVEVVRPDGTAAEPGEAGEILLTTLQKLQTPLIRYRIGDLGSLGHTDCPCGISGRTLDYLGRADGLVKVKARTVAHSEILTELRGFEVSQLQVVIDTADGTETVTVLAETDQDSDPEMVRAQLAQRFEALSDRHSFGDGRDVFRFRVRLLPPGAIARDPVSGKVRPVVDHRIAAGTPQPPLAPVFRDAIGRFRITDVDGGWLRTAGGDYLGAPLFAGRDETDTFGADLLTVARLLSEVPARLGHPSAAAYARQLGYGDVVADLIDRAAGLPEVCFGRVDALRTGDGFRTLEFNATSETGGLEWVDVATHGWRRDPAVAAALSGAGVGAEHATARIAETLRRLSSQVTGVDKPSVALVGGPIGVEEHAAAWFPLRDQLIAQGLPTVVTGINGLTVRDDGVYAGQSRVHVVYRIFALAQIAAVPEAVDLLRGIIDEAHRGTVAVFTSVESELHRDKRTLAALTENAAILDLTLDELAAVDRIVPPTVTLPVPLPTEVRERLLAERATTILKPARGYAGTGIVAGWEISDDAWAAALDAITVPTVAQRRVVPAVEPVLAADGTAFAGESVYGIYYLQDAGFVGGGGRVRPHGSIYVTHDLPEKIAGQRGGILLNENLPGGGA